jgi:hypothetical protein
MKIKSMMVALALLMTGGAANAGSNECEGAVIVGNEWTTVIGKTGDYAPNGCQFKTTSRLGRRILAVCPDKTECWISLPFSTRSVEGRLEGEPAMPIYTITSISGVQRR